MKRTTIFKTLAPIAASILLLIGGCQSGGTADNGGLEKSADALGNIIGGQNGQWLAGGLKAGYHAGQGLTLNEAQEDQLGQTVALVVTNQFGGITNNDQLARYVNYVGLAVASTSPRPDGNYVFGVLNSPEVGGFSGPNGYIMITTGTLQACHDESELAGVLAHEISHVYHKDGLQAVRNGKFAQALGDLAASDSRVAAFSGVAGNLADEIVNKGFSKDTEYRADADAVKYVSAAGYDPAGYLHFMQRLVPTEQNLNTLKRTHPLPSQRVGRIQQALANLPQGGATMAERYQRMTGY
jgi:predicted Zn-dependent protease